MKKRICQLFILVAFIAVTGFTAATTEYCIIKGKVVDKDDKSGISYADVNYNGGSVGTSDWWGNFSVKISSKGDITLLFSKVGYISKAVSVNSQPGFTVTFNNNIELEPEV